MLNEAPPTGKSVTSVVLTAAVLIWQVCEVAAYSSNWPTMIFDLKPKSGMGSECKDVFTILHATATVSLLILVIEVGLLLVPLSSFCRVLCAPCVCCFVCVDCVAGMTKLGLAVAGLIVILKTDSDAAMDECSDLYTCGWWTYLGFLLLGCCIGCCFWCCIAADKAAKKHGDEEASTRGAAA